jgi:hypothetical protein
MSSLIARSKALHKRMVVCGCVPQGDKKVPELQELSLLGELLPAASFDLHPCLQSLPVTRHHSP